MSSRDSFSERASCVIRMSIQMAQMSQIPCECHACAARNGSGAKVNSKLQPNECACTGQGRENSVACAGGPGECRLNLLFAKILTPRLRDSG